MFYNFQKNENRVKYKRLLNGAASFGILNNPKSKIPIIDWRHAERIFCLSFNARDIATQDVSIDSIKSKEGIGIKTFQGSKTQKIAEFNNFSKYPLPKSHNKNDLAKTISVYRNERLEKDLNNFDLEKMIYHFTYRKKDASINIYEQNMHLIDVDKIILLKSSRDHIVKFFDGKNSYSFNSTKSTLYMNFNLAKACESFHYNFNKDDISFMIDNLYVPSSPKPIEEIEISLYSERSGRVEKKSGLNQWNASGRSRHHDEVYIPIPIRIHKEYPGFFPDRDSLFSLKTDSGEKYLAKICQSGGKALMSNPNRELGRWILRNRLNLKPGTIVTREILERSNSEKIKIVKYDNENYSIYFI